MKPQATTINLRQLTIAFIMLFLIGETNMAWGQQWLNNLPRKKIRNHTLTFKDYQKAFYSFYKEKKTEKTTIENNERENRPDDGDYERFKRWEWYWKPLVNPVTGAFPTKTAYDVLKTYKAAHAKAFENEGGNWVCLGAAQSKGSYAQVGRVDVVAFSPADTNIIYVGTPGGGIWKSTDAGKNWRPLGDFNPTIGIADILVENHGGDDIIYLGTGTKFFGYSVGLLKSVDGGNTWQKTGLSWPLSAPEYLDKIVKAPFNDSVLYVAAYNSLYKTTDAGKSFTRIANSDYLFSDIKFQPGSNVNMYAGDYYGRVYYSTDTGNTWTIALDKSFDYQFRTVLLGVSPDSANVVYAVIVGKDNGLLGFYRSNDYGHSYQLMQDSVNILGDDYTGLRKGGQGNYDLAMAVDPDNANKIYVGGINTWVSEDGGKSWKLANYLNDFPGRKVQLVHPDKHCLAFQPGTHTLFEGNDGGILKSKDGKTWTNITNGLAIGQVYRIGVSATVKNEVIAGLQDNGTKLLSSGRWEQILGGDGWVSMIDPRNDNVQYATYLFGGLFRTKDHWKTYKKITNKDNSVGILPYVINPQNHNSLYSSYMGVFKSTDQGDHWEKLTRPNDPALYLTSLAVSPSDTNYIYAISNFKIFKSTDEGHSFEKLKLDIGQDTISDDFTSVTVKNDDKNTVWVTLAWFDSLGVIETKDGGKTWKNISDGLPQIPVHCLVQNTQNDTTEIYVGTEAGVFVRKGDGKWLPFSRQLPNARINDLKISYDSLNGPILYAATQGRSIWYTRLPINPQKLALSAKFDADKCSGFIPFAVHFKDQSTGNPTSWLWNFGDGDTSTLQNPTHTYTKKGIYSVSLVVYNKNNSDTLEKTDYIIADSGISPHHFKPIWSGNPYQPMNIIVDSVLLYGFPLKAGDEIGVFDTDRSRNKICVGAGVVTDTISSKKPLIIIASGDDPETPAMDGFINGHTLIFKVWDADNLNEITTLSATYNHTFDTVYTNLGSALITFIRACTTEKPATPEGPTTIILGTDQSSEYTIPTVQDNVTYTWFLHPDQAGTISGNGKTATVTWNSNYTDTEAFVFVTASDKYCGTVASDSLKISLSPVGISQQETTKNILISPNPTHGKFTITLKNEKKPYKLIILNSMGKIVLQKNLKKDNNQHKFSLDLGTFPAGIYYLRFVGNQTVIIKKIMINKLF